MRMKTSLFLVGLLAGVVPARADWLRAGQDDFSTIYYDPATRRSRVDGAIELRALTDYDPQSPQAAAFKLSEKGLSEIETAVFDCAKGAYRSQGGSWYAGHMATGSVRSDYPAKDTWSKVPSFYASLFTKACARD
jgi:hypothetical protein